MEIPSPVINGNVSLNFIQLDLSQSKAVHRLLPPANEVCEGYVFTGVCLSTGGHAWHVAGGMHGRGHAWQEGHV